MTNEEMTTEANDRMIEALPHALRSHARTLIGLISLQAKAINGQDVAIESLREVRDGLCAKLATARDVSAKQARQIRDRDETVDLLRAERLDQEGLIGQLQAMIAQREETIAAQVDTLRSRQDRQIAANLKADNERLTSQLEQKEGTIGRLRREYASMHESAQQAVDERDGMLAGLRATIKRQAVDLVRLNGDRPKPEELHTEYGSAICNAAGARQMADLQAEIDRLRALVEEMSTQDPDVPVEHPHGGLKAELKDALEMVTRLHEARRADNRAYVKSLNKQADKLRRQHREAVRDYDDRGRELVNKQDRIAQLEIKTAELDAVQSRCTAQQAVIDALTGCDAAVDARPAKVDQSSTRFPGAVGGKG